MAYRIGTDAALRRALGTDGTAWANSYLRQRKHVDGDARLHELAAWFDAAIGAGKDAMRARRTPINDDQPEPPEVA